jgi:hypothetical protein
LQLLRYAVPEMDANNLKFDHPDQFTLATRPAILVRCDRCASAMFGLPQAGWMKEARAAPQSLCLAPMRFETRELARQLRNGDRQVQHLFNTSVSSCISGG